MNTNIILEEYWENEYKYLTQFDVNSPDRWVKQLENEGEIVGQILDSGCGPGRTSQYLANLGYLVTGIDISSNAIRRAKNTLNKEGGNVQFIQADLCNITGFDTYFDTIIDIGCFHSLLNLEDCIRYTDNLFRMSKPNAKIYLRAFSSTNLKNNSDKKGLPAISKQKIQECFSSEKWTIMTCEEKEIELLVSGNRYKKGYCWFVNIQCNKL